MMTGSWLASCLWVQHSSPFIHVYMTCIVASLVFLLLWLKTTTKSNLGRKDFVSSYSLWYITKLGHKLTSRIRRFGTEADHGRMLFIELLSMPCSAFLDYPGPPAHSVALPTVHWALLYQSRKYTSDFPTRKSDRSICSIEICLLRWLWFMSRWQNTNIHVCVYSLI